MDFLGGAGGNGPPGGAGRTGKVKVVPEDPEGCERSGVTDAFGMEPAVTALWPIPGCALDPATRLLLPWPPLRVGERFCECVWSLGEAMAPAMGISPEVGV